MATTGFWPVKSRLKEVIDYAENPDKTIDKRYVDSDLYATLQYISNDKKTDKPLRKELSIARAILEKIPRFEKLLETERQMETAITMKHKERRYER